MNYFQTSDDTKIAYQYIEGESKQLPIVLVHGGFISSKEWQHQQPVLNNYTHLLVDIRGHGDSERNGYPYSIDKFADDIKELLEHLQLQKIILGGHSLGGIIIQKFVSQYPSYVNKLMLIDTSYSLKSTPLETFLTSIFMPIFNITPVKWQAKIMADSLSKQSKVAGDYVHEEISKHANNPKNYRAIWEAMNQFNGYKALDKIKCCTLILAGQYFTQAHKQAQIMNERIPNSKLVYIEEAGHMLNWDNPTQFNQVMLDFIES